MKRRSHISSVKIIVKFDKVFFFFYFMSIFHLVMLVLCKENYDLIYTH